MKAIPSICLAICLGLLCLFLCFQKEHTCFDARLFCKHLLAGAEGVLEDFNSGAYPEPYDQRIFDLFTSMEAGKHYPVELLYNELSLFGNPSEMSRAITTPWGVIHFELGKITMPEEKRVKFIVTLRACDGKNGIDYVMRAPIFISYTLDCLEPGKWNLAARSKHWAMLPNPRVLQGGEPPQSHRRKGTEAEGDR